MRYRKSASGVTIDQTGEIDECPAPAGTKPCPWCKKADGLVVWYATVPKPEQAAMVMVRCGRNVRKAGEGGCGARGPWRLNPIVLTNPEDETEVLAYFRNMAQVAWSDWNKQGDA